LAIVALAVVALVVWGIVYLAGRGSTPTAISTTPPATSPQPTTSATNVIPVTTAQADFPGTAKADPASLQVIALAPHDPKCNVHTVGGTAAYYSDCTDWGSQEHVLYFFYVTLSNRTGSNLAWKRGAFAITSGSNTFKPVDVRSEAADPTTYLQRSGKIAAQGSVSGYVVFKVQGSFDPSSLAYHQGDLSLTINFVGQTATVPRG